jgi:hypothetical protein
MIRCRNNRKPFSGMEIKLEINVMGTLKGRVVRFFDAPFEFEGLVLLPCGSGRLVPKGSEGLPAATWEKRGGLGSKARESPEPGVPCVSIGLRFGVKRP